MGWRGGGIYLKKIESSHIQKYYFKGEKSLNILIWNENTFFLQQPEIIKLTSLVPHCPFLSTNWSKGTPWLSGIRIVLLCKNQKKHQHYISKGINDYLAKITIALTHFMPISDLSKLYSNRRLIMQLLCKVTIILMYLIKWSWIDFEALSGSHKSPHKLNSKS